MDALSSPGAQLTRARRRRRTREITRLVGRRAAVAAPVLLLISLGLFLLAHASPFDPLAAYLGERYQFVPEEQRDALGRALGVDRTWWVAWSTWITGLLHGDLGHSHVYAMPVAEVIAGRLPWTLLLSGVALLVALVLALAGGFAAAFAPGSWVDRLTGRLALLVSAVPPFALALGAILVFSLALGLFPLGGAGPVRGPATAATLVHHLALPALVLGISQTPWLLLSIRSEVSDALDSDAVRGALLRGLGWPGIVDRHIMPVTLAPVVSLVGMRLPELIVGAILVEEVFAWPGLAASFVTAARSLDLPLLAILTLASSSLVLLGSLLADVAYLLLDPRVRVDD